MARQPTIYDVARAAGVSPSTVSRTFSRPGRVSTETATRVRRIADDLGFRTRPVPHRDALERSSLVVVMVSDLTNPVYHGIIEGAHEEAAVTSRTVLVCDTRESAGVERDALERVLPFADGLVLATSRMSDAKVREVAKRRPVVVLNRVVAEVPSLVSDQATGAVSAIEHLRGLGHERVTYLAGPEASWADGVRWRAAAESAAALGMRVRRAGPFSPTIAGGVEAAAQFLSAPTSSVLAYNDLVALGFMREVAMNGWSVPEDVSVVGFDDILAAHLVTPGLTTVAAPLRDMGASAVRSVVHAGQQGEDRVLRSVTLPTRLVIRGSTAQPSRKSTSPA